MQSSTATHNASDGTAIHVHAWTPDEGAGVRAVVHIAHGMAEHGGRYARLAGALTKVGFAVYAHDHRGHGKTAQAGDLGHFGDRSGWRKVVGDLRTLVSSEMDAHRGLPFVVLGHSMGSFMTQDLLFDMSDRLAAVVLSASSGKPSPIAAAGRLIARAERLRLGNRGKSPVLEMLSVKTFNKPFAPNRTECDWLSRDEAEVDAYVADPLCGFECTTTTWVELLDALGRISSPELQATIAKKLPVYILAGSEDPVSERTRGLRQLIGAYERAGLRDVTQRIYPGGRHEILNETNRDTVTAELITWLEARIAR